MRNINSLIKDTEHLFKKIIEEGISEANPKISLLSGQGSVVISIIESINKDNSKYLISLINNLIDQIIEIIEADENPNSTYCNGLAGVGWLVLYLIEKKIIKKKPKDFFSDIDLFLDRQLKHFIKTANLDLLHGALGIGLYFLKRRNYEVVDLLLCKFIEIATENDGRLSFSYFDSYNFKTDVYDFGLAHGHSGILYFLNKCQKSGLKNPTIKKLKDGIINFFLYNIKRHSSLSYFPSVIPKAEYDIIAYPPKESRLAWCYGDLTILYTLLNTSISDKNKLLNTQVEEYLIKLTERKSQAQTNIIDPFFCHGTSGVGYIFLKTYQITGNELYLKSANYWLEETLKYIKNSDFSYNKNQNGLLSGMEGVYMFLNAMKKSTEVQTWDECLFLS